MKNKAANIYKTKIMTPELYSSSSSAYTYKREWKTEGQRDIMEILTELEELLRKKKHEEDNG